MKNPVQLLATFCIGAICGGSILLAIASHDMDMLYYQLAQIRLQYQELLHENAQLKLDLKKQADERNHRIRKLDIHIQTTDDAIHLKLQQYIQKYIQNLCKFLIGRPLQDFEPQPDLVQHLLNGRAVLIDDKTYIVRVDAVVITETLHVWLHLDTK
ncbi:hypothetical protein LSG31_22165 [Fodinisporobacter ferrooxydans]|uniref:Sporulation membrane protein YtrI C-terminal domain-containing protein n=1 Tax=Fodinisporobacter ferrooxydans TaxID=2901836 RepID=A0ABY4CJ41_9BACL|nr:hypothetical protein LSG31_22165 [Alicyclobacillaceae bacterium MYW30-H2]